MNKINETLYDKLIYSYYIVDMTRILFKCICEIRKRADSSFIYTP